MLKNNADQIRARLRAERKAMPVAQRQRQSLLTCEQLLDWFDAHPLAASLRHNQVGQHDAARDWVIAAYWPLPDEPDIIPVLEQLVRTGVTVVLPVVAKRHCPLEFHRWSPELPMTAGHFGVMEPARTLDLEPDILLVPTLGYTHHADRLGYGGGYYDRTLAEMQTRQHRPVTIGISWSEGLLSEKYPDYRPERHDMPLDAILSAGQWTPHPPKFA